ncbi:MAG: DUF58 domain-containing protein [Chloroflexota bacterium]|nr:DUF58 domain-containing protein [Chloroflexota bacterium]
MRALLNESWLSASLLLVVLGLTIESVPLLGLGALVLGAGGAARLWSRLSLEDVGYRREVSEHRAFVGERVQVTMHLTNEKVLPVPWIEVRERLPDDAPVVEGRTSPAGTPGFVYLTRTTALRSADRLEWPLELRTVTRGYHRMGPARLKSGDLFGLFEREEYAGGQETLIVYPRTYPLEDLGVVSARPFGEHRGGSRIFPDPIRVVGVRDYIPGDPLKQIDWNATARAQRLQSRLYEPSREHAMIVALDVMTLEHTWEGSDPVLLERAVVVAASIARDAFDRKSAIGLISNGALPDADRPVRIGAGRRPDQLTRVLEALAGTNPFAMHPLSSELERRGEALSLGATIVVVAALMPPDLAATLQRLSHEGHTVHVIKTSDQLWDQALGSIPVTEVSSRMEVLEEQAALEDETQPWTRSRVQVVRVGS